MATLPEIDAKASEHGAVSVGWSASYEWKAILLLSLGFGLVALDRFLILPMFPVIMRDLHLSYSDLGNITGALAITWGISAFWMGKLSDRVGRRKIVVGSLVVFSCLVGLSGLAQGVASLILLRALMGFAEGAYVPPSIAATLEASLPHRHGLNVGLQQVAAPLFGLGVAPIMVTHLMNHMAWRAIFLIVALPGAIIAWLLHRTLREQVASAAAIHSSIIDTPEHSLRDLPRYRNVLLAAIGMITGLNSLIVLSAFLPSYLIDRQHLNLNAMGYVMSAIGVGAVIGTVAIPALSDRFGRKLAMICSSLGATVALYMLSNVGADPPLLFSWLLVSSLFNYAMLVLVVGPVSMEAVPPALRATATGAIIGVGELFGGGIAPSIAGYTAHHFGISHIFTLAIAGQLIGVLGCLGLKESAPALARRPG